jgi:tetratricopeptide (TPR) repeat protein
MKRRAPQSRLLARLDAAIAKVRRPVEAACLRAERAGFLARHGHFDEARVEINALHSQFDHQPNPAVSAWLCIVEGWQLHFSSLSSGARDKMMRAQALSAAAGLTQLHALSSAWLAHMMDYTNNDIDSLVRNVSLSLRIAAADNHSARARACMVVALAYDFAERLDLAQPWYARAREHAVADGDETTQSALNFNISAQRVHHAMQAAVFGGDAQGQARYALAGAECAGNFDAWVGTVSLDALLPMQRACIASVQGQYGEALGLYEKHLAEAQKQGLARLTGNFLADMAWCRWHLGDRLGAERDAQAADAAIDTSMHMDDRATAHGRLDMMFKLLGDETSAARHAVQGRECWAEHRKCQAMVVQALEAAALTI